MKSRQSLRDKKHNSLSDLLFASPRREGRVDWPYQQGRVEWSSQRLGLVFLHIRTRLICRRYATDASWNLVVDARSIGVTTTDKTPAH